MCYEFERLYWLERAAQALREKQEAEGARKNANTSMLAKPDARDSRVEEGEPVPS